MHDMDRTQTEFWELNGHEMEGEWIGEGEYGGYGEAEGVFSEAEEMEFAAQLLEVGSEAEMDQFLGNLFRKASSAIGGAIRSPVGQALGGMLKNVARQALPAAGSALASRFGAPPEIGQQLASAAGSIFGLELEGLSSEDQEFEAARQYVRLAGEAAKNAAQAPTGAPPQATARQALTTAARDHAPGLVRQPGGMAGPAGGSSAGMGSGAAGQRSGRWMRRGNKIVLYGI